MVLEPEYTEQAETVLDRIEKDLERDRLWDAICDVLHMICEHPESSDARRERVRVLRGQGLVVWKVPVRAPTEAADWVVLWYRDGGNAVILYVGEESFRTR